MDNFDVAFRFIHQTIIFVLKIVFTVIESDFDLKFCFASKQKMIAVKLIIVSDLQRRSLIMQNFASIINRLQPRTISRWSNIIKKPTGGKINEEKMDRKKWTSYVTNKQWNYFTFDLMKPNFVLSREHKSLPQIPLIWLAQKNELEIKREVVSSLNILLCIWISKTEQRILSSERSSKIRFSF